LISDNNEDVAKTTSSLLNYIWVIPKNLTATWLSVRLNSSYYNWTYNGKKQPSYLFQ
jgi:hypothetical protein